MSLAAGCPRCPLPLTEDATGTAGSAPTHGLVAAAVAPGRGDVRRVRRAPEAAAGIPDVPAVADEPGLERDRLRGRRRRAGTATRATLTCTLGHQRLDGPVDVLVVAEEAGHRSRRALRGHPVRRPRRRRSATSRRRRGCGSTRQPVPPVGRLDERLRRRVRPLGARRRGRAAGGCGSCCGRRPRCCCCATTGSCATSPASGRSWSSCRSGGRRRLVTSEAMTTLGTCASTSTRTPGPATAPTRPPELVRAAAAAGLDVLAITDHDTADGWARGRARPRGRPASSWCRAWRSAPCTAAAPCTCSPTCPTRPTRRWPPSWAGSSTAAAHGCRRWSRGSTGSASTSPRTTYAGPRTAPPPPDARTSPTRWSTLGVVPDRTAAFDRYLGWGRPAHVDRYAAPLEATIRAVAGAGGVTVVAHPWGRGGPGGPDEATLAALARPRPGRARGRPPGPRRRRPRPAARDRPQPRPGRHRLERLPRHRQDRPRPRAATPPRRRSTSGCWSWPRGPPPLQRRRVTLTAGSPPRRATGTAGAPRSAPAARRS